MKRVDDLDERDPAAGGQVASGGVDWGRLIAESGLDADELLYLRMNKIGGRTRSRCAAELGWSMAKVERIRRRLNLHLAKLRRHKPELGDLKARNGSEPLASLMPAHDAPRWHSKSPSPLYSFVRGNSLNPFYREQVADGRFTWALSPSNELMIPTLPIVETVVKVLKGKPMEDLHSQLRDAKLTLGRIEKRCDEVRQHVDHLEESLSRLRVEAQKELELALLEERGADPKLQKQVAAAEVELSAARQSAAAHAGAVARQKANIQAILDAIEEKRHEAFLAAVTGQQQRLNEALEVFLAASIAVHTTAAQFGYTDTYTLFPSPDPSDPTVRSDIREWQTRLVWQAIRVAQYRTAAYQQAAA